MRMKTYKKPKLPPAGIPWLLVSDEAVDGPFYTDAVITSDLPGKPATILGGSPRVLRVTRQKRNRLTCDDGTYEIVMAAGTPDVAGFPRSEL